jgi:hypothetical protein
MPTAQRVQKDVPVVLSTRVSKEVFSLVHQSTSRCYRARVNVRPGSIASVWLRTASFRSTPVNGHREVGPAGPFDATSRLCTRTCGQK